MRLTFRVESVQSAPFAGAAAFPIEVISENCVSIDLSWRGFVRDHGKR